MNQPPLPSCNLQNLIDAHIRGIHENIKSGIKAFAPILIVEAFDPLEKADKPRFDIIIFTEFGDYEQRRALLQDAGGKYYDEQRLPIGVAMASEAWLSHQTHARPSESDDRQEVLMIAAVNILGGRTMAYMPIRRDKKQNMIEAAFVAQDGGKTDMFLLNYFYKGFFQPLSGTHLSALK